MPSSKKESNESRLHAISGGEEPTFDGLVPLEEMELCRHLNWYNQHRDTSHAHKYLQSFCTKHQIDYTETKIKSRPNTLGYVCRMLMRGAVLSPKASVWLQNAIQKMDKEIALPPVIIKGETSDRPKTVKVKPANTSSQAQLSACLGALDQAVDELILSDCKRSQSPLTIIQKHELTQDQIPAIINKFKQMRDEYRIVLAGTDAQLVEGYSNFTIPEIIKLESYADQIMSDALLTIGEVHQQKAPRKKKVKTPEQLTKHLKYHDTTEQFGEYAASSIDAKKIIGASALYVYNIRTRQLGVYVADTDEGLSIKGSSILNYTASRSVGKTLRKPLQQIPQFIKAGKVQTKHFLGEISTKEKLLAGRINKDCLLLKVL
jgi:hypothetical protein